MTEPNEFEEFLARSPDPEDDLLLEPNVVPNALGHFLSHIAARITRIP